MSKLPRTRRSRTLYKKQRGAVQMPKQVRKQSTPEFYARMTNGQLVMMLGAAAVLLAVANASLDLLVTSNVL